MSVTREQNILVLLAQLLQFVEERQNLTPEFKHLGFKEELNIYKHLVVSRPSGVNLLAKLSISLRKQELHL